MAGGRRVTWGDLDVHYFDYGLGDSPAVSCGVAARRGAARAARPEKARLRDAERHSPPRWLEPATRRALLREAGFSEGDIEAARKAGTLTEAQAIVLQERLRKEMEAKIATLEERLGGQLRQHRCGRLLERRRLAAVV